MAKKAKKLAEPASRANLKRHDSLPVPHVATWVDGRPLLDTPDAKLVVQAVADHRCHLCGQSLGNEVWVVIVSPQALRFGFAGEPSGHFECLQYATAICPYLRRRPVNLIVSCQDIAVVERPHLDLSKQGRSHDPWHRRAPGLGERGQGH